MLATVFFSHAEKELIEFIGNGSVIFSKSADFLGKHIRIAFQVGVVSVDCFELVPQ